MRMSLKWVLSGFAVLVVVLGCAPPPTPKPIPPTVKPPASVDRVVVMKGAREMHLMGAGQKLRSYRVSLGFSPIGHKTQQGDGRTPEGTYTLDWRNPHSQFHRSINISYPNPADRDQARRRGVDPGGEIMIHGLPNGRGWIGSDHARFDWTEGCIAVTNEEMDEIWAMVADGTPIEIRP
jgi:murein L,D-transpeptidase YafK